jgi:TRAP-type C4-dicarboxylate transport system permease small subunit
MAVEASQPLKVSYPASGDLSASQYFFVALNSSGQAVVVTSATQTPIGVLQNKPKAAGQMAEVVVIGVTKVVAAGTIAVGAQVSFTSAGKLTTPATGVTGLGASYVQGTQLVVGFLYTQAAAAANDVTTAVINCLNPLPAS